MNQTLDNPRGRLDLLLLRLAEECTRRALDPAVSRIIKQPVNLWELVKPLAERIVIDAGIPARPITVEDVFRIGAPKRRRQCTR